MSGQRGPANMLAGEPRLTVALPSWPVICVPPPGAVRAGFPSRSSPRSRRERSGVGEEVRLVEALLVRREEVRPVGAAAGERDRTTASCRR